MNEYYVPLDPLIEDSSPLGLKDGEERVLKPVVVDDDPLNDEVEDVRKEDDACIYSPGWDLEEELKRQKLIIDSHQIANSKRSRNHPITRTPTSGKEGESPLSDHDADESEWKPKFGSLKLLECMVNPAIPLDKQKWYYCSLTRQQAERLLEYRPEGSFLVRKCESSKGSYSLSLVCSGETIHIRIDRLQGSYILGEYGLPFATVSALIEHYSKSPIPVHNAKPLKLSYALQK